MRNVAVIGAGPAGIEAATLLQKNGFKVTLFEKSQTPLDNIRNKAFLFPNAQNSMEIVHALEGKLAGSGVQCIFGTEITGIEGEYGSWHLTDNKGDKYRFHAILLTTGYKTFDATRKEELGYGIYTGVVTSIDMEAMIRQKKIIAGKNDKPQRVTFLQCVGSRDEKVGNHYCSKLCCVTAVKQAIETKMLLPNASVSVFYMDLRMWGKGFEELYRKAQEEFDINFIRGRISETAQTFDGRVQIKSEDTLLGVPIKMTTDLLVLMVGMEPSSGTKTLGNQCHVCGQYGFIESVNPHTLDNFTSRAGIFVAGTAKHPMSIRETLTDAQSAAISITSFLTE